MSQILTGEVGARRAFNKDAQHVSDQQYSSTGAIKESVVERVERRSISEHLETLLGDWDLFSKNL